MSACKVTTQIYLQGIRKQTLLFFLISAFVESMGSFVCFPSRAHSICFYLKITKIYIAGMHKTISSIQ